MGCEVEKPDGNISSALQGAAVGPVIAPTLWSESTWKYRLALFARQSTVPGWGRRMGRFWMPSRTLTSIFRAPVLMNLDVHSKNSA